jgi:hypothetical protein
MLLLLASQWQPLSPQIDGKSPQPHLSREQMDERDAMAAVLDTFIQLKVTVPADSLRNLTALLTLCELKRSVSASQSSCEERGLLFRNRKIVNSAGGTPTRAGGAHVAT